MCEGPCVYRLKIFPIKDLDTYSLTTDGHIPSIYFIFLIHFEVEKLRKEILFISGTSSSFEGARFCDTVRQK